MFNSKSMQKCAKVSNYQKSVKRPLLQCSKGLFAKIVSFTHIIGSGERFLKFCESVIKYWKPQKNITNQKKFDDCSYRRMIFRKILIKIYFISVKKNEKCFIQIYLPAKWLLSHSLLLSVQMSLQICNLRGFTSISFGPCEEIFRTVVPLLHTYPQRRALNSCKECRI